MNITTSELAQLSSKAYELEEIKERLEFLSRLIDKFMENKQ